LTPPTDAISNKDTECLVSLVIELESASTANKVKEELEISDFTARGERSKLDFIVPELIQGR